MNVAMPTQLANVEGLRSKHDLYTNKATRAGLEYANQIR
jgi:hypothetical protein